MAKQNDKRQKAKSLYLTGQYTQKEIAEIIDSSEKTICKWKEEEDWENLKTSLLTTRENELKRLYKFLKNLNDYVEERIETIEMAKQTLARKNKAELSKKEIFELTSIANSSATDSKTADSILKITAAIHKLEIETSIADKVEVGTDFINIVRKEDVELAKQITTWFDIYLKQSIK